MTAVDKPAGSLGQPISRSLCQRQIPPDARTHLLASRWAVDPACKVMMSESSAAPAASRRIAAVVGIVFWATLSSACSGASTDGGGLATVERGDEAGAGDPTSEASSDGSSADEPPSGPAYMGKPIADPEDAGSGSIASADGRCPIPDTLDEYGASCSSCAGSHCVNALSECDPTMVNACTAYYCPTQCPQPREAGASGDACAQVMQCCPTLFGTALGLQCLGIQASSAQSDCQMILTQAQAIGHCE
jgi:hypothetical protein